MKITCSLALLFILLSVKGWSQTITGFYEPSKHEQLSTIAYTVFKTNKFLNFKDADTLKEFVDGKLFKSTGLSTFFDRKKEWVKIGKEDTSAYRNSGEKYSYQYTDSAMTETYSKYGSYGVHREFKTIYNPKGFIQYVEEQVFLNDSLVETRSTRNIFDQQYRVIKIVNRVKKKNAKNDSEETIKVDYKGNEASITSEEQGTIKCVFVKQENTQNAGITHPAGQDKNVYRMFNGTISETLLTITIDKNVVNFAPMSKLKKVSNFTEQLIPTSDNGIYYFKTIAGMNGRQSVDPGYSVMIVDAKSRYVELFVDTVFSDKAGVEGFVRDKKNLVQGISYLLVSELSLQEARSLPGIMTLTEKDQAKFKQLMTTRLKPLLSMGEDKVKLTNDTMMKLYVKQQQIIDTTCFLLGYQPPQNGKEMDFLRPFLAN